MPMRMGRHGMIDPIDQPEGEQGVYHADSEQAPVAVSGGEAPTPVQTVAEGQASLLLEAAKVLPPEEVAQTVDQYVAGLWRHIVGLHLDALHHQGTEVEAQLEAEINRIIQAIERIRSVQHSTELGGIMGHGTQG